MRDSNIDRNKDNEALFLIITMVYQILSILSSMQVKMLDQFSLLA
jgi:hypothetical protein